MRRLAFAGLLVLSCGSQPDAGMDASMPADSAVLEARAEAGMDAPPSPDGARYDEVQQKSVHNAYDKDEPLFDQIVFHRAHSVEIDIHVGKNFKPPLKGDWYVYHADIPGFDATTCEKLSDCLGVLRTVHEAFPQHEIVTVLIDLKDDFKLGQAPTDLDAMIDAKIGKQNVLSPGDLLAACPSAKTLRDAVTGDCKWPLLSNVRGKFVFALTGGSACMPGTGVLNAYTGDGSVADQRLGFIAPSIDDTCAFPSVPYALFFNMDYGHMASAKAVRAAGLVGRIYYGGVGGGLDDQPSFDAAKQTTGHHLATDMANYIQSPFTVMHSPKGWPFVCVGPCNAPPSETMRLFGIDVRSGDIEGSSDSFFFAHGSFSSPDAVWTSAFAVASSHVQEWAKGCIMARETLDADSPYVAVCRPADVHPIRSQARLTKGGGTQKTEAPAPAGLTSESVFFGRLTIAGNTAKVEASADDASWLMVASYTFQKPLALQGIAASGHDSADPVRFVFGNVTRDATAIDPSKLPNKACVGACPVQSIYDGPLP